MLIQNDAETLTQQGRFNDQNQIHTIAVSVAVSVTVQYANSKRRRNTYTARQIQRSKSDS